MTSRRDVVATGTREEIDRALDAANLLPEDRSEVERFRRYLRGEMDVVERFAYEHGDGEGTKHGAEVAALRAAIGGVR